MFLLKLLRKELLFAAVAIVAIYGWISWLTETHKPDSAKVKMVTRTVTAYPNGIDQIKGPGDVMQIRVPLEQEEKVTAPRYEELPKVRFLPGTNGTSSALFLEVQSRTITRLYRLEYAGRRHEAYVGRNLRAAYYPEEPITEFRQVPAEGTQ